MSEATAQAAAPVAGAADGAPSTPQYVSDTTGMSETQAQAMAFVDQHRAEIAKGTSNFKLLEQNRAALEHAFHGGPVPDFVTGKQAARADVTREHDSLRDAMEQAMQPAGEAAIRAAVDNVVIQGVSRGVAQQVAEAAASLELSEGAVRTVLDRVRAHYGADHEHGPDASLAILSDAEVPEFVTEAARIFGSMEKLQEVSGRARDLLAHRGVLEKFDRAGLTRSSLAFDPKFLTALAHAADVAGIPQGKG